MRTLNNSFLLLPFVVFPGQSSKCKNEQKAITPKELGKAQLCTALLLNEIYLPTKFLVDTSCNFITR